MLQTSPKLHTPFPIKKFEIRFSYLLEISPLQEMDKSLISPISPTSGLMSAPLRWNRTYHEHHEHHDSSDVKTNHVSSDVKTNHDPITILDRDWPPIISSPQTPM